MTERFENILTLFGRDITITRGETVTAAKAFLQPLPRSADDYPYAVSDLGTADTRRWKLLTRGELADGDEVFCGGRTYAVRSCAAVYAGRELSHYVGYLEEKREARS